MVHDTDVARCGIVASFSVDRVPGQYVQMHVDRVPRPPPIMNLVMYIELRSQALGPTQLSVDLEVRLMSC